MLQSIQLPEIYYRIKFNNTNFNSMIKDMNIPVYSTFIPSFTGIYLIFDILGELIYIGKATNLKDEISQHLSASGKNKRLKENADRIIYFVMDSIESANLTEATMQYLYLSVNGYLPYANRRLERKPLLKFNLPNISANNLKYRQIA